MIIWHFRQNNILYTVIYRLVFGINIGINKAFNYMPIIFNKNRILPIIDIKYKRQQWKKYFSYICYEETYYICIYEYVTGGNKIFEL